MSSDNNRAKIPSLQEFAKQKYGIVLTDLQLRMIGAWTDGMIINAPKASGKSTANKVIRAYVKAGLAQPPKEHK